MRSSDEDLLRRIGERDQDALLEFYDLYGPRVFGLLRKVIGDPTEAEDVLQEVMWEVWQKATNYDPTLASPTAWVLMMARGRGIDRVRKRQRELARIDTLRRSSIKSVAAGGPDPGDATVNEALEQLSPDGRGLLSLAYFSGLTREQIADATGVPVGTVKTRIRANVRALRDILLASGART